MATDGPVDHACPCPSLGATVTEAGSYAMVGLAVHLPPRSMSRSKRCVPHPSYAAAWEATNTARTWTAGQHAGVVDQDVEPAEM
jgi:hypothetical protein